LGPHPLPPHLTAPRALPCPHLPADDALASLRRWQSECLAEADAPKRAGRSATLTLSSGRLPARSPSGAAAKLAPLGPGPTSTTRAGLPDSTSGSHLPARAALSPTASRTQLDAGVARRVSGGAPICSPLGTSPLSSAPFCSVGGAITAAAIAAARRRSAPDCLAPAQRAAALRGRASDSGVGGRSGGSWCLGVHGSPSSPRRWSCGALPAERAGAAQLELPALPPDASRLATAGSSRRASSILGGATRSSSEDGGWEGGAPAAAARPAGSPRALHSPATGSSL
jgi:hypothetical protein